MRLSRFVALVLTCVGVVAFGFAGQQTPIEPEDADYGAKPDARGPIGGGNGYTNSITRGDYIVKDLDALLDALSKAKPGQIVFIPDETEIDLTARIYTEQLVLNVPAGVTLAGNRGHEGSLGALLASDALKTPAMIHAAGPNVRVTGLRLRGPNPKRYLDHHQRAFGPGGGGHKYYYQFPASNGISTEQPGLEVDNCDISGFSRAGIYLFKGDRHYLHHNFIHHCQYNGLGYGICLDTATSLIERNLFDFNRHSIAGTGHRGCSYEARHNIQLGTSLSHCFDMHGAKEEGGDDATIAGDWIKIHHNTFKAFKITPIKFRGRPIEGGEVHHNWFLDPAVGVDYWKGGDNPVRVFQNQSGPAAARPDTITVTGTSKPWKYDVTVIESGEYKAGVPQGHDCIYCDENGHIWLKVRLNWPDEELASTDQYLPRSLVKTMVSRDQGLTWSFTETPYPGPPANRSTLPDGTLIETGSNYYIRYPRSEMERLKKKGYLVKDLGEKQGYCAILYDMWMRRSRDGGQTWEAKPIHQQFGFFSYFVPFPVQGVLSDGTVVSFAYGNRKVEEPKSSYILRSQDAGDTWKLVQMADGRLSPSPSGFNEMFPVIFPDGRILALLRTDLEGDAYLVRSADGGQTWSKPVKTPIQAKHPVATLLRDGTIVVTYQRRSTRPYGYRGRFTSDLGKTWSDEVVLRDEFEIEDGLGWTHTVELPDGTLFTTAGGNKYVEGKVRRGFQLGVRWTRDYRKPMGPHFPRPPRAPVHNVVEEGRSPWAAR